MLKTRVIPTLLWKDVGLVKGVGFDSWRRIGSVLPAVKVYNRRAVDELVLLDISATPSGRRPLFEEVAAIAQECFVPLTVGGGVRSLDDFRQLLQAGADKVAVNSGAHDVPDLIHGAARRFGTQCVVASIDARRDGAGAYEVYAQAGTRPTGLEPAEWAAELERLGAGEILITSIDRDGTQQGYDLELIRRVTMRVRVPVIASGGAGTYDHFVAAVKEGGASAVAAASMFHFTEQTPLGAKEALARSGVPVRRAQRSL